MATVSESTVEAVASTDTPAPPERIAILCALALADGLPIWKQQSLILVRGDDIDQSPILSLDFHTPEEALAWGAYMGDAHSYDYGTWTSTHVKWHGWSALLKAQKPKAPVTVLDDETAALAEQLAATVNPEPTSETEAQIEAALAVPIELVDEPAAESGYAPSDTDIALQLADHRVSVRREREEYGQSGVSR